MTATATNSNYCPALTIIKGKEEYEKQVQHLTGMAWQIAYTSLWNGMEFSTTETEKAKTLIQAFIKAGSPLQQYSELVQRVLLARQYILSHPGTYAPLPSCWLQSEKGFAGTEHWYKAMLKTRSQLPAYKQYLKALPEAVLEVLQNKKAADFHYWRSWFAANDAQAILNLYLSVLANYHYSG